MVGNLLLKRFRPCRGFSRTSVCRCRRVSVHSGGRAKFRAAGDILDCGGKRSATPLSHTPKPSAVRETIFRLKAVSPLRSLTALQDAARSPNVRSGAPASWSAAALCRFSQGFLHRQGIARQSRNQRIAPRAHHRAPEVGQDRIGKGINGRECLPFLCRLFP